MIRTEKAESWRTCNCCNNPENVKSIILRYEGTNSGTQIALCDACIKDLISKITPHEEWKLHTYIPHNKYCPICGKDSPYNKRWNFCPNCGTKLYEE